MSLVVRVPVPAAGSVERARGDQGGSGVGVRSGEGERSRCRTWSDRRRLGHLRRWMNEEAPGRW